MPDINIPPEIVPTAETSPYVIANAAAGVTSRVFTIPKANQQPGTKNPYDGKVPQSVTPNGGLYKSQLGTWVQQDIVFQSVTYTDQLTGKQVTTPQITHYTILINVTMPKIEKKEQVQGRPGTVKEYISDDDFQIQINGIISGPNGVEPTEDMQNLYQLRAAPVPIPVVCAYLNDMGVYYIVIEELALTQDAGGISTQKYTISAVSDRPVELYIT